MNANWVNWLRKFLMVLPVAALSVFFEPRGFAGLGSISWLFLTITVYLRPLSDMFPNASFLKRLVPARKEFGIAAALFGIAHGIGFFLNANLPASSLAESTYWSLGNGLGWGMWACVVSIPLLATSNLWSMKMLKGNWKRLQRLTYLFFVAAGIHVAMIKPHEAVGIFLTVGTWAVLWTAAYAKVNFQTKKILAASILAAVAVAWVGAIAYQSANAPVRGERPPENESSISSEEAE